ncbi:outer membrane lipoprotein chaperone LolA [Alkalimarinus alittae]|uniref:Outer-membrane lipoprotein carrier protein n=1 Tax=Alkalimarinus alittae TaxID=2961619 RepID=A0ABY6N7A3_9ALTE|nr:outer membrane lipoprotein chaperone LolA [Alkalimarinus alittae]UZE97864.1 outer membrane lipoprotein chaperone LolA [Alkalimarinus alittae]
MTTFKERLFSNAMRTLIAFNLIFISVTSHADEATESLIRQLEKLQSIEAHFVQYVVDKAGTSVQESRGILKAKRPGLFYWHTEPPLEQVIVSDGHNVIVYDPDLEQATVQPVTEQLSNTPALLFSGDVKKLGESYLVHHKNWDKTINQYVLMPRGADSLFESLRLRFDSDILVEMRLTDSLGQKSTIGFNDAKINSGMTDKQFEFIIPEGTDVIRELGQ